MDMYRLRADTSVIPAGPHGDKQKVSRILLLCLFRDDHQCFTHLSGRSIQRSSLLLCLLLHFFCDAIVNDFGSLFKLSYGKILEDLYDLNWWTGIAACIMLYSSRSGWLSIKHSWLRVGMVQLRLAILRSDASKNLIYE